VHQMCIKIQKFWFLSKIFPCREMKYLYIYIHLTERKIFTDEISCYILRFKQRQ